MAAARSPALLGSALLHAGLITALIVAMRVAPITVPPPIKLGDSTPVSIVAAPPAPEANVREAIQAPVEAPAQSQTPTPEPPRPEPAPAPAPRVAPPPPAPKPPKPAPRLDLNALEKTLPSKRAPELDLSKLAASLPKSTRPAAKPLDLDALAASLPASRHGAAPVRGPARPETAQVARPAVGAATGLSGDVRGALAAKLTRLWNPGCEIDGVDTIVARVRIHIGADGGLTGAPELLSVSGDAPAPVRQAAGQRALSAVSRGAPYIEVPAAQRAALNPFTFNFNGQQACRNA